MKMQMRSRLTNIQVLLKHKQIREYSGGGHLFLQFQEISCFSLNYNVLDVFHWPVEKLTSSFQSISFSWTKSFLCLAVTWQLNRWPCLHKSFAVKIVNLFQISFFPPTSLTRKPTFAKVQILFLLHQFKAKISEPAGLHRNKTPILKAINWSNTDISKE